MAAKSARKSTVKRKETPEQKAAKTASQDHKSRRGRGRQSYRSKSADAITDSSYLATIMKASELAMHLF
jgi:hypothetical protein